MLMKALYHRALDNTSKEDESEEEVEDPEILVALANARYWGVLMY